MVISMLNVVLIMQLSFDYNYIINFQLSYIPIVDYCLQKPLMLFYHLKGISSKWTTNFHMLKLLIMNYFVITFFSRTTIMYCRQPLLLINWGLWSVLWDFFWDESVWTINMVAHEFSVRSDKFNSSWTTKSFIKTFGGKGLNWCQSTHFQIYPQIPSIPQNKSFKIWFKMFIVPLNIPSLKFYSSQNFHSEPKLWHNITVIYI